MRAASRLFSTPALGEKSDPLRALNWRDLSPASTAHLPGRPSSVPDVAPARKLAISSPDSAEEVNFGAGFRVDRQTPRLRSERADVFALAGDRSDRYRFDPQKRRTRALRARSLRSDGKPCALADFAKSRTRPVDEILERIFRKGGEPGFGTDRGTILAKGILRPLGAKPPGV